MDRVFIDSDIILDVFAKRKEFFEHSAKLLSYSETNKIAAYTTPLVFSNIYYVLRRIQSREYALQSLRKLRLIVGILPQSEKQVDQALNSSFTDFEDALQYYCSIDEKIDYIVTRNKKDYKESSIPACTPEEFMAILESR